LRQTKTIEAIEFLTNSRFT